jgi:hypothetical protein
MLLSDFRSLRRCKLIGPGVILASLARFAAGLPGCVLVLCVALSATTHVFAQEVRVWEYAPYEVEVCLEFDSASFASSESRQRFADRLTAELQRTYRAAWSLNVSPIPLDASIAIHRSFESFTVEDLLSNELVLVISVDHPQAKLVRTFEAALSTLPVILVTESTQSRLQVAWESSDAQERERLTQALAKCQVEEAGLVSIIDRLNRADVAAALVRRDILPSLGENIRTLATPLPWQLDHQLRKYDKLIFLRIEDSKDGLRIQARELDCSMHFLGPAYFGEALSDSFASRVAATVIDRAFAPVARVEDAESATAVLRLRAGGLIVNPDNPAAVRRGEVMQPIVRRDDRNGIPTLLEPLSWTFAAVTHTDGVELQANVYSYSGGPGLRGRMNRRTERVLLRVRPLYQQTELEVVVRGTNQPQPGCFVYQRDLLTEDYQLLGRTDWRGRLTVAVPDDMGGFLPEAVRRERYLAEQAAKAAAAQQTEVVTEEIPPIERHARDDRQVIPLRAALTQLYVKSGEQLLAKLPIVPGLKQVETAELQDDRGRLNVEAFVSGFQGEILDLIGLRNLLAARVRLLLKDDRLAEAEAVVDELRRLRNFDEMADELELIQRRALNEREGEIPASAKNSIDRMFQTTRDLLQKYLQDDLVDQTENSLKLARQADTRG